MPLLRKRLNGTHIIERSFSSFSGHYFHGQIRKIVGFRPSDITLYEKAFIHRSVSLTRDDGSRINNERLEFLGDAVLDAILSEHLFKESPKADEGKLTKIRSRVVNREVLNDLAISIGIDTLLESKVNRKHAGKNIYGDALEALIGAVFIDKGYLKSKEFIISQMFKKNIDLDTLFTTERDYKSQVFQWAQKLNKQVGFTHTEEYKPEEKQTLFTTTLRIDHEVFGEGKGTSKKEAEQEASYQALSKIQIVGFID